MKGFDTDWMVKADLGIADGVDLPVDGGDGDAEQIGVGLAELGDVVGGLAAGHLGDALMQFGEIVLAPARARRGPRVSQRSNGIDLVQRDPQAPTRRAANREFQAEIMPCRNPASQSRSMTESIEAVLKYWAKEA